MRLSEPSFTSFKERPAPAAGEPTVFIVDDNPRVRDSIRRSLQSSKIPSESFGSAPEFLRKFDPARPGCLVVDFGMKGIQGREFHREFLSRGPRIPVIVTSGFAEASVVVSAIRAGAVDFLQKPLRADALLRAVREALARNRDHHQEEARLASLTPRERQILHLLVAGENYKEIAGRLEVSTKTVEGHRVNMLRKLGLGSAIDVVRFMLERKLS